MGMCSELITSATMSVTRLDNAPTTVTTLEKSIAFLVFGSSDALQIEGMVKVISNLNFKYVGALYIDDAYGTSGIQGLISQANSKGICVSEPKSITEDSTEQYMKYILREYYIKQGVSNVSG
jgi:hypothetical protein